MMKYESFVNVSSCRVSNKTPIVIDCDTSGNVNNTMFGTIRASAGGINVNTNTVCELTGLLTIPHKTSLHGKIKRENFICRLCLSWKLSHL